MWESECKATVSLGTRTRTLSCEYACELLVRETGVNP